jgi:hypothetical protein
VKTMVPDHNHLLSVFNMLFSLEMDIHSVPLTYHSELTAEIFQ